MKSLKLGTLIVASMFALNSFAQATTTKTKKEKVAKTERVKLTPEQKATKQTERLTEKLGLTEDQKSKAYEINLGVNQKNQAIRENTSMTKEQKVESIKQNNQARSTMIRETLNDEQKAKFDAIKAKHDAKKAEMKGKKGKKGAEIEEELEDEGL